MDGSIADMNLPPTAKTALVLAGGGSPGAGQVGMCKALSRHGVVPACDVVAIDWIDGSEVLLTTGEIALERLARVAMPVVLHTVALSNRPWMDGGIASHTPLSAEKCRGATWVLVLPAGLPCTLGARSLVAIAMPALNLPAIVESPGNAAIASGRGTIPRSLRTDRDTDSMHDGYQHRQRPAIGAFHPPYRVCSARLAGRRTKRRRSTLALLPHRHGQVRC